MKIRIQDITEEGLSLEGTLPAAEYDLPITEGRREEAIEYCLTATLAGEEVLVQGILHMEMLVSCARCLELMPLTIHIDPFQHSYPIGTKDYIDLTQEIREDILLGYPMAPRCQLDADYRCPMTGQSHRPGPDEFAESNRQSVWGELEKNLKKKE